jgi:hypothetical protein
MRSCCPRVHGATNFNHVKNQSRGHAKKVECISTFMVCPRAVRWTKNAQVRQLQRKSSNVRSAREKRLQWKMALNSRSSMRFINFPLAREIYKLPVGKGKFINCPLARVKHFFLFDDYALGKCRTHIIVHWETEQQLAQVQQYPIIRSLSCCII